MHDLQWSPSEKKHARALFDQALRHELSERIAEFKERAAGVSSPDDMWSVRRYLEQSERDVERKYDYRYSQLLVVFGTLLREGRVTEEQLAFLSEEKLAYVSRVAAL